MKKYIGTKEIKTIQEDNIVIFKDKTKQYFCDKELAYLVTDEPKDLSQVQGLMLDTIVPAVLSVLEDFNLRKGDIQMIIQEVIATYNNTFNIAVGKAFGTFEEGKHSAYFPENIRISDIKKFK